MQVQHDIDTLTSMQIQTVVHALRTGKGKVGEGRTVHKGPHLGSDKGAVVIKTKRAVQDAVSVQCSTDLEQLLECLASCSHQVADCLNSGGACCCGHHTLPQTIKSLSEAEALNKSVDSKHTDSGWTVTGHMRTPRKHLLELCKEDPQVHRLHRYRCALVLWLAVGQWKVVMTTCWLIRTRLPLTCADSRKTCIVRHAQCYLTYTHLHWSHRTALEMCDATPKNQGADPWQ